MPGVLARGRMQRNDGSQVQVVAACRVAQRAAPRRAVGRAEVHEIQCRVMADRVPRIAAAAEAQIGALPCLRRLLQRSVGLRLRQVARHRVEAPHQSAAVEVITADITSRFELGAAVSDDNDAAGHLRRAGHRVGQATILDGIDAPQHAAVARIQRMQMAIEAADIDLALPDRDAAIDQVAARIACVAQIHPRLEAPTQRTGRRIQRVDATGHARGKEHTINDDRRGLHAPVGAGLEAPCEAQAANVLLVDPVQRGEVGLAAIPASREPLVRFAVRRPEALRVNVAHGWSGDCSGPGHCRYGQRGKQGGQYRGGNCSSGFHDRNGNIGDNTDSCATPH